MSQLRQIPRLLNLNTPLKPTPQLQAHLNTIRPFTTTPKPLAKPLPPRLKLDDADLTVSYLKGTGPGGQKINKTNSAVQISHKPSGIVIKCQATRSQSQNEKIARSLLADRVEAKMTGDPSQSRIAIKAEAARKKKASKIKKAKRKYRDLEKGKESEGDVGGEGEVDRGDEVGEVEVKSRDGLEERLDSRVGSQGDKL